MSEHIDRVLRKLRLRSVSELVFVGEHLRRHPSISRFELGGVDGVVIDTGPASDAALWSRLSPAERHVAGLVLDGLSTSEIAELRRSAYRTVANQLASVYDKLGVNSRLELGRLAASAKRS